MRCLVRLLLAALLAGLSTPQGEGNHTSRREIDASQGRRRRTAPQLALSTTTAPASSLPSPNGQTILPAPAPPTAYPFVDTIQYSYRPPTRTDPPYNPTHGTNVYTHEGLQVYTVPFSGNTFVAAQQACAVRTGEPQSPNAISQGKPLGLWYGHMTGTGYYNDCGGKVHVFQTQPTGASAPNADGIGLVSGLSSASHVGNGFAEFYYLGDAGCGTSELKVRTQCHGGLAPVSSSFYSISNVAEDKRMQDDTTENWKTGGCVAFGKQSNGCWHLLKAGPQPETGAQRKYPAQYPQHFETHARYPAGWGGLAGGEDTCGLTGGKLFYHGSWSTSANGNLACAVGFHSGHATIGFAANAYANADKDVGRSTFTTDKSPGTNHWDKTHIYRISDYNLNACGSGTQRIVMEQDCRTASQMWGGTFVQVESKSANPRGCFANSAKSQFWLNVHTSGAINAAYSLVCQMYPDPVMRAVLANHGAFGFDGRSAHSHLGTIQQVIYTSGTTALASNTGTIFGVASGTTYNVKVEVLRNDLASASEYVSAITFDGSSIGSCNPDGGDYDCTFYNCASTLSSTTYTPTSTTIAVVLTFVGHSHDCDCDTTTWQCSQENTVSGRVAMTAVARISLTVSA